MSAFDNVPSVPEPTDRLRRTHKEIQPLSGARRAGTLIGSSGERNYGLPC